MSNLKIKDKKKEAIKTVNKKIKESFSSLKSNVENGKINIIRSLNGLIHCAYDVHPERLFVSALKNSDSDVLELSVEQYVNIDKLTNNLKEAVRVYLNTGVEPENIDELLKEAKEYSQKKNE